MLDNPLVRITIGLLLIIVVVTLVLAVLPDGATYPYPESVSLAVAWVVTSLWYFDFILPTTLILWAITIAVLQQFIFMNVKLFIWLYNSTFKAK